MHFLPASSYVLWFSLLEGNRHKRSNKTHFVAFGFVETYPVVFLTLLQNGTSGVETQTQDWAFIAVR